MISLFDCIAFKSINHTCDDPLDYCKTRLMIDLFITKAITFEILLFIPSARKYGAYNNQRITKDINKYAEIKHKIKLTPPG